MNLNMLKTMFKPKNSFDWETKIFLEKGIVLIDETKDHSLYKEEKRQKRDFASELKVWDKKI